jgi:DNA-binding IscR family transcriptional regulator
MKHIWPMHKAPGGGSSSAREISRSPNRHFRLENCFAKVLQRLVRARLLVSVSGTRGRISIGQKRRADFSSGRDQAVDGPVTVTACSEDDHNCDQYTKCSIRDPLWKIKNKILES